MVNRIPAWRTWASRPAQREAVGAVSNSHTVTVTASWGLYTHRHSTFPSSVRHTRFSFHGRWQLPSQHDSDRELNSLLLTLSLLAIATPKRTISFSHPHTISQCQRCLSTASHSLRHRHAGSNSRAHTLAQSPRDLKASLRGQLAHVCTFSLPGTSTHTEHSGVNQTLKLGPGN